MSLFFSTLLCAVIYVVFMRILVGGDIWRDLEEFLEKIQRVSQIVIFLITFSSLENVEKTSPTLQLSS